MKRRVISTLLILAMVMAMFPTVGFASTELEDMLVEQNVALGKTVVGAKAKLVDAVMDDNGIADWTDFGINGSTYNGYGLKFVEVDLAQSYDIKRFYIKKRTLESESPVSIWAYNEKKTTIQSIVDGDGFIGTIEGTATNATFNPDELKNARYIYLTSSPKYVGIYELEAYADAPLKKQTFYVSSSGSESNTGLTENSPITLEAARVASKDNTITEIIVLDDIDYVKMAVGTKGYLKIVGKEGGTKPTITIAGSPQAYANLEFSNMNINMGDKAALYMQGRRLKINSDCTMTNRIYVYGGGYHSTESYTKTELILLGGKYYNVYGGGNGPVNGDTNIIFGGNANAGDSINESSSAFSPTHIYGGGAGGVAGSTNITMEGNAVARYACGAYRSTNSPAATNITIKDNAKIMNVYGGTDAADDTNVYPLSIDRVTINMEGGDVESIFGGCYGANLTGNVFINWSGGNIRRRLYTGCYNNYGRSGWTMKFFTNAYVIGSTVLSITGDGTMSTANLDTDNNNNNGIYPGSRYDSASSTEHNTIIYQNDCYSSATSKYNIVTNGAKQKIPVSVLGITTTVSIALGGYVDYTVKSGVGGKALGTATPKVVYVQPEDGRYAIINSTPYQEGEVTISSPADIKYDYNFKVNSASVTADDKSVNVAANITANNFSNESAPYAAMAIYNAGGKMMGYDIIETSQTQKEYNFSADATLTTGQTYFVKIMLWDSNENPIVDVYSTYITK